MARKLTQHQEGFCLDVFNEVPAGKAYLTHYKCKPSAADALASRLIRNAKIQARLAELRKKVEDASVASVLERKQILTEALRVTPEDILELSDDTRDLTIKPEALKSRAVSYIRTEQISIGKMPVRISRIGLMDKVRAAAELNKMEKIYSDGATVNVDNRKIEIHVNSEKAKELTERLIEGERTQS
jgi:phage terminase small subunit